MYELTDLELLVLTRVIGGLSKEEFQSCLNSDESQEPISPTLASRYFLQTKLRKMAAQRGVDCNPKNIITTKL